MNSIEDAVLRRRSLLKIITQFKKEGKQISRFTLQPALKEVGFDVSFATVYRDMTVLNRENTWVRDLVESNYSAYQEQIYDTLEMVEREALELYQNKPEICRKIHKEISKNGTVTTIEETTTEEVANMTSLLLEIILKVQALKIKHFHGDNINVSAALLSAELQDAKDKLQNQSKAGKTHIVNVLELAAKRVVYTGDH
ncbi:MAG: hypothetical protein ACREAD_08305 [Nitrosopumilaceae archaeon]